MMKGLAILLSLMVLGLGSCTGERLKSTASSKGNGDALVGR
jgi:hypothetical protein